MININFRIDVILEEEKALVTGWAHAATKLLLILCLVVRIHVFTILFSLYYTSIS